MRSLADNRIAYRLKILLPELSLNTFNFLKHQSTLDLSEFSAASHRTRTDCKPLDRHPYQQLNFGLSTPFSMYRTRWPMVFSLLSYSNCFYPKSYFSLELSQLFI